MTLAGREVVVSDRPLPGPVALIIAYGTVVFNAPGVTVSGLYPAFPVLTL